MTDSGKIILALQQLPAIGRKTVYRYLLPDSIDQYDEASIISLLSLGRGKTSRIKEFSTEDISSAINKANHIIELCDQMEIKTISICDPDFPERLRRINDPPVLLYYRGNITLLNENHTIAIIGTRDPTEYGFRIAVRIGEKLAESGITTISGLALGCDTGGHTGTLNKNGTTVAILANGLDTIYPKENRELAYNILRLGGCIISEYPPQSEVQRGFFVDRDRLQAALSDAVFVVETDINGGTMHTVEFSQKYDKQIYCFNHPEKYLTEPKTRGNQKLIIDGTAIAISGKDDINAMIERISQSTDNHISAVEQLSMLETGE